MMYDHWTQELVTKEDISFLVSKNCPPALLGRLMARIARRHGRPRRRMPKSRSDLKNLYPDLNEAA